jgi:hypothetical protein
MTVTRIAEELDINRGIERLIFGGEWEMMKVLA